MKPAVVKKNKTTKTKKKSPNKKGVKKVVQKKTTPKKTKLVKKVPKTKPISKVKKAPKVKKVKEIKIKQPRAKKPPKVKKVRIKKVKIKKIRSFMAECILTGSKTKILLFQANKQVRRFRFDTVEEYMENYISKEAQILLKKGFSELEIRQQFKCSNTKPVTFQVIRHYVKKIKSQKALENQKKRKVVEEFEILRSAGKIECKYEPIKINFKNPEQVKKLTTGSCLRPDIYLNNRRSCEGCGFFEYCACEIKKLAKKSKNA